MPRPDQPSEAPRQRQLTGAGVASFTDEGRGPAFVCLHGLPGSVRDFRWLAPPLAAHGRVIRLELPGFGACPAGDVRPTLADLAVYVAGVIRAMDLGPVALVGHSFGAMVAAAAAHRLGAGCAGVALVNPIGLRPHAGFRKLAAPRAWRRAYRHDLVGLVARPLMQRLFERAGFRGVTSAQIERTLAVLSHVCFDGHRGLVSSLPGPVFMAWSEDDPVVEADISQALSTVCPAGPRLRFLSGGHNLQKYEALALAEALGRWQASLPGMAHR